MILFSHKHIAFLFGVICLFISSIISFEYTYAAPENESEEMSDTERALKYTYEAMPTDGYTAPLAKTPEEAETFNEAAGNAASGIGTEIGLFILNLAAGLVYFAGSLFDFSLTKFAVQMGDTINNGGIGFAINNLWVTVRDLCNLAFIFGFLYVGIRTVFSPDSSEVKRFLGQLVIAALLINFSLFITKFVIDFSNFTTHQIYYSLVEGDKKISEVYAENLGISKLYKTDGAEQLTELTSGGAFWFFMMGAIMLMVAAFVFASGAILLVVRFVALVFIMIFSPVLFAATLFPGTAEYASKLWKYLINYAFFAPAYLFLLLVSVKLTDIVGWGGGERATNGLYAAVQGNGSIGAAEVIGNFLIVILFLIMALQIAKSFGIAGAETTMKAGNSLRKGAQGYLGRGMLHATRVGWAADKISKKQDEWRNSNSRWKQSAALALRGTGMYAGAKGIKGAKFGSSQSRADVTKENEEIARARRLDKDYQGARSSVDVLTTAQRAGRPPTETEMIKMEQAVADSSTDQLVKMLKSYDPESTQYKAVVGNMSAAQYDAVMKAKDEDFSEKKKDKLREVRRAAIPTRLVNEQNRKNFDQGKPKDATFAKVIGKANAKELDSLDFESQILPNAGMLTSKQVDDMTLTETARNRLKNARDTQLFDEFTTDHAQFFGRITNEVERSKLPGKILKDSEAAGYLTEKTLNKIVENDGVSLDDRRTIKANVLGHHNGMAGLVGNRDPYDKMVNYFDRNNMGRQYN